MLVAGLVAFELRGPVVRPNLWDVRALATLMAMPKAPTDEERLLTSGERDVGSAGEALGGCRVRPPDPIRLEPGFIVAGPNDRGERQGRF